jgi:hypothetical protein
MRSSVELREQSIHVFWHFRQTLHLSAHLEAERRRGVVELVEPLDAAALAAFAVSARALTDFIWRDRQPLEGRKSRESDAFAVDWLSREEWDPGELPSELRHLNSRVGEDIAHISYRRLDRGTERGWQPVEVASRLAYSFAAFAERIEHAHPTKVADGFQREVWAAAVEWRGAVDRPGLLDHILDPALPTATPAHPSRIGSIR